MNSHRKFTLVGAILVGITCGLAGAAYGSFLYMNPDYRESLIRKELSAPHPDNRRYVAAITALRYQGLVELIIRNSVVPLVIGSLLGAAGGSGFDLHRGQKQPDSSDQVQPAGMTPIEWFVVLAIIVALAATLAPIRGTGQVYHNGKDQFYWLEQIESGPKTRRPTTIAALCELLERKPFPCRSTIIPALAECGSDARVAIPVLERLTTDAEEKVKQAAFDALKKLKADAKTDE